MLMKSHFNADKAMLELLYKTITVYLKKTQFSLKGEKQVNLVLVTIKFIFLHQV